MTNARDPNAGLASFSLLGGPLHRAGLRLGLVRAPSNTIRLGLALGLALWLVATAIALANGRDIFSFAMLGAHARLLLAIPLMFVAEAMVDPRMDAFMQVIVRSRVVPGRDAAALQAELARVGRWKDAWLPEAVCLVLAAGFYWLAPWLHIPGTDSTLQQGAGQATPAGLWYSFFCLTVLRFLLLRWVWRMLLWWHCLWFLSRLPLRLAPAHADGAAGLGALEVVQVHFAPLLLGISTVLAASFAVDIHAGRMAFDAVYPATLVILLLDALLFISPMLLFVPRLWASKVQGIEDFMVLSEDYATGFEQKWIRSPTADEPLLGSSDIQSLADLHTAVEAVHGMRIVPVASRTLLRMALLALLPLSPLVLFKIPLTELAGELIGRLTGM